MVVDVSITDKFKIFPELIIFTAEETSLSAGNTDLFKLKKIGGRNKVFKPINYAFEQVSGVVLQPLVDFQERTGKINVNQLPGISTDHNIFGGVHALDIAAKEYILQAQNSGSASTDFRSRLIGLVDAFDTATKLSLIATKTPQVKLSARDEEAMEILRKRVDQGKPAIDFDLANKLGISIPQRFEDFLKIHEVVGALHRSLADSTNLATGSRTRLADIEVPFKGERAIVLESVYIERPTQSELGEVNAYISRDDDADLVTFDPAELRGDNVRTDLHIHAFNDIQIEFDLTSGTHNSYKASAVFSVRKIGIGFKAKMLEFLGANLLPEEIEISTAEKDIIDDLNLLEVSRVGMEAIG